MSEGVKVCINCGDRFGEGAMAAATGEPHGDWRPCPKPAPGVPLVDCGVGGHMYRCPAVTAEAAPSPDLDVETSRGALRAGRYTSIARGAARLAMMARAAAPVSIAALRSEVISDGDTLVELERKLLGGEYVAAQPLRIIGLPAGTILTEVSNAGLTLRVHADGLGPDALAALDSVVGIVDRVGGYMTPADQEAMRTARALLARGGRDGRG